MYLLLTRDAYPLIMMPSLSKIISTIPLNPIEVSPIYLLYFIPFLLVDILLLVPIPIAVMFEAFKVIF
jgi:hypothetical protein